MEQPLMCACLKFVYIECEKVDEGVREILNILGRFGILRDQISIKEDPRSDSDCKLPFLPILTCLIL